MFSRYVTALSLTAALAALATPAAGQSGNGSDTSGPASGSTVAGGSFAPQGTISSSGTNPVVTAQAAAAVSAAGQAVAGAVSRGNFPGTTVALPSTAAAALSSVLTGKGGGGAGTPNAPAESPSQVLQNELGAVVTGAGSQVTALVQSIQGILPTPSPAQLQRAVTAWNDMVKAAPPAQLPALAASPVAQAVRGVLNSLNNAAITAGGSRGTS